MLPVWPDVCDGASCEILGGEAGNANVGASDGSARHPLHTLGELQDGITLWHESPFPELSGVDLYVGFALTLLCSHQAESCTVHYSFFEQLSQ